MCFLALITDTQLAYYLNPQAVLPSTTGINGVYSIAFLFGAAGAVSLTACALIARYKPDACYTRHHNASHEQHVQGQGGDKEQVQEDIHDHQQQQVDQQFRLV